MVDVVIRVNILKKDDISIEVDPSTTIEEIIDFFKDSGLEYFENVSKDRIIVKSQSQKTLLRTQTIQQVLSQEKSDILYIEIEQEKQIQKNQTNVTIKTIKFVKENKKINCDIEVSTTLEEILNVLKKCFNRNQQVSLFYKNNPLLDIKQTLDKLNLPNNCTIDIKVYPDYD